MTAAAAPPIRLPARKPDPFAEPPGAAAPPPGSQRLASLDAFRGFVMLAMASAGFQLSRVAQSYPGDPVMEFLRFHTDHVPWVGCSFWDLIQPAFMFMVGVALPFSQSRRVEAGGGLWQTWGHTFVRALVLVLLGIFLSSTGSAQTNFTFVNVLTQIGLGYVFLYALRNFPIWAQGLAAVAILLGYWAAFATYHLPPENYDWAAVGVPSDWAFLQGNLAHWEKNANIAHDFDVWFLNLFRSAQGPPAEAFAFNSGGYQTLNFIPSLATMIFGLMAGRLLRSDATPGRKFVLLFAAGLLLLLVGWLLGEYVPLVKRIWTPSWAVYSTGWVLLMLAGFFGIIDVLGFRAWSLPLIFVGMNSIAVYCVSQTSKPWIARQLQTHFGQGLFENTAGLFTANAAVWAPAVQSALVLFVIWLMCWYLYQNKLFFRI